MGFARETYLGCGANRISSPHMEDMGVDGVTVTFHGWSDEDGFEERVCV